MELAKDKFPQERFGIVTGSRCSPLVPVRSAEAGMKTLAMQLANEMYWQTYDEMQGSWHTEHGKMSEHDAFLHWNTFKLEVGKVGKGKWHKEEFYGGSTDAEGDGFGVDFKCPTSLNKWLSCLHDPLEKAYYDQCQLYMLLTGFDVWYLGHYLSETIRMYDIGILYPVPEEKRMIVNRIDVDHEWRDKFMSNLPKVIEMRNQYLINLINHFG